MPSFNYDGCKIAFEQRGRKQGAAERPIVLIHGLLLPRIHHYPLADALAELADGELFTLTSDALSGHSAKHMLAALSFLCVYLMLKRRVAVEATQVPHPAVDVLGGVERIEHAQLAYLGDGERRHQVQ